MKVWISRDKNRSYVFVDIWNEKPRYESPSFFGQMGFRKSWRECLTPTAFKNIFGFTPRKGTCKQYELTLKEKRK